MTQTTVNQEQDQIHIANSTTGTIAVLPPHAQDNTPVFVAFLEKLGIDPSHIRDQMLFHTAFIHKSYAADYNGAYVYNERLEFLGDAILGAIVAKYLYLTYPDQAESALTLYKIALVRAENLARVAQDIGLDSIILLGKWEERNNGREKTTILCDCLEAFLGYLYIDYGTDTVANIIENHIVTKLVDETHMSIKSYKSHLQEHLQKEYKITPHYIEEEYGKDTDSGEQLYQSHVYLGETVLGSGIGTNKKKAQEQAAKEAYINREQTETKNASS